MAFDEQEIIQQILHGDADAFGVLVEEYQQRVFRICLGFMKNELDAHDMAQEVFISIYEHIGEYKFKCQFSTWVYRICTNHCLNRLKKLQRLSIQTDNNLSVSSPLGNPEQMVEAKELRTFIHKEINKLKDIPSKIMTMRLFQDKKFKEISEILDIPSSTARTYFIRYRRQLQESLTSFKRGD